MLFNTVEYLIFLPIVVLIYYILPGKVRYVWLAAASCYFYMQWNPLYILLLLLCAVITFCGGRMIANQREKQGGKHKVILILCITFNLIILGYYKYFRFFLNCINMILPHFQLNPIPIEFEILLPVGISFYTLQALGYLMDVYWGGYVERNFLKYFLFVSFFPQLVAGPIERSGNLLVQLEGVHKLNFWELKKGVLMILYGLFLKMVIADRAAILVDTVFGDPKSYQGFFIIVAALFFSIQIYCDFYGYSIIARGSALLMGIHLMENFSAPYYSRSIKEFWGRWHISLSTWFRDYLYIPLGGNRKGILRTEGNRLLVFAISGFWHGASMGYMFWGFLHGVYQLVGDLTKKIKSTLIGFWNQFVPDFLKYTKGKEESFSAQLFQRLFTLLLVVFAWLFFRAGGLTASCQMVKAMFSTNNWTILLDGSLYGLGVSPNAMFMLVLSIIALFVMDYQKYKGRDIAAMILRQGWIFQMLVMFSLVFVTLLYGCYGEMYDIQQFIYFQF